VQREVVKLSTDIPVTVLLDRGPEGFEREGKFGVDYQYTVNRDAGIMWLPRQARDAVIRSGAQAGDEVEILKQQHGNATTYRVRRLSDAAEAPAPAPKPVPAKPRAATPIPARAYYQPETAAAPAPRQAETQPTEAAAEVHPITRRLMSCLCSAIDACSEAETYARSKHFGDLEFTSEDIRAAALTIFINLSREGR